MSNMDGLESLAPVICVLGGRIDAPNNGVAALGAAAAKCLRLAFPNGRIMVQSHSSEATFPLRIGGETRTAERTLLHYGRRLKDRTGSRHIAALTRLLAHMPSPVRKHWMRSNRTLEQWFATDVVADISGGDSFSEIYGPGRFEDHVGIKEFAIAAGKPLFLLPQTYGPFKTDQAIERAGRVMNRSLLVATRDQDGIEELRGVLGSAASRRLDAVPDVAFALDPVPVSLHDEPAFSRARADEVLVGLNISGLLWFDESGFGMKSGYRELTKRIVDWALSAADTRLVLVPHAVNPTNLELKEDLKRMLHRTSDESACREAMEAWRSSYGHRIGSVAGQYGPGETKFLIGQCDFFIGARMHACIAAVSQGVPAVTLAYSKKAAGVMGYVDAADMVVDLRRLETEACVVSVDRLFRSRRELAAHLKPRAEAARRDLEAYFTGTVREMIGLSARGDAAHQDLPRGRACTSG